MYLKALSTCLLVLTTVERCVVVVCHVGDVV